MISRRRPLDDFLASADRRTLALMLGGGLALTGALVGLSLAVIGPIYTTALVIALAGGVWIIAGLRNALWAIIGVIALLPYATLPFKVVVTPTFLDIAMGAFFFLYIGEWLTGERRRLATTPVHVLVVLFMVLATFNFVAGLRYGGLTSTVIRRFAEFLLSMSFSLVLVDVLKEQEDLRQFVLIIMLAGTAAAALGIVLWVMPDTLAESLLRRLSVIGYPDAGIIHYVEDNPELPERAIATTVDPNALGGLLVMIAALVAPQVFTENPITKRRWLPWVMLGTLSLGLLLTLSRGSMLAFAVALIFIGAMRYRKLLLILMGGAVLILVLPWTQYYVARMLEGFQGVDLATQMRFGEFKDSFKLISRYPLFGVGFSGTPDIDIYLAVSNVYLAIAANMGLLGLGAFLTLIGSVLAYGLRAYRQVANIPGLRPILLGLLAGLVGALVNGMFDHYFFNLAFHPAVTILWTFIGLTLATSRLALASAAKRRRRPIVPPAPAGVAGP